MTASTVHVPPDLDGPLDLVPIKISHAEAKICRFPSLTSLYVLAPFS